MEIEDRPGELIGQTGLQSDKSSKHRGISGSTLKIIAMVSMLIDHIAAGFLEKGWIPYITNAYGLDSRLVNIWSVADTLMRDIGRLAFPVFCFLLVEGYFHTSSVKRYLGRLFIFALISEIPFDLAIYQSLWYPGHQNVLFTLFLGLLAIYLYELTGKEKQSRLSLLIVLVGVGFLAMAAKTDYSFVGVLLIFVFYVFRDRELMRDLVGAVTMLGAGVIEIAGYVAFIPIHFYNGKRGLRLKYVFYCFYPLHLLVIGLVRMAVFGS